jgi:hypothetical protein
MTLQQYEKELEALEQDADAIYLWMSAMPAWRLHLLAQIMHDELALRSEGKPAHTGQLH